MVLKVSSLSSCSGVRYLEIVLIGVGALYPFVADPDESVFTTLCGDGATSSSDDIIRIKPAILELK
jgi:hypothetical protein